MKKAILLIALIISSLGFSQEEIKEGKLVVTQKMSSDNEQMNAQIAMMGDMTTTTYFKDDKSRTEVSSPMTGDMTIITSKETNESITFMDNPMLGKKYIKGTLDVSQEQKDNVSIRKGDLTKTFLGYECQQYFVTGNMEGQTMEMELYATDAINAYSQQTSAFSEELKGFPLFMTMTMSQMGANITITSEVTEINKETISDDKFSMAILEGYDEMKQN